MEKFSSGLKSNYSFSPLIERKSFIFWQIENGAKSWKDENTLLDGTQLGYFLICKFQFHRTVESTGNQLCEQWTQTDRSWKVGSEQGDYDYTKRFFWNFDDSIIRRLGHRLTRFTNLPIGQSTGWKNLLNGFSETIETVSKLINCFRHKEKTNEKSSPDKIKQFLSIRLHSTNQLKHDQTSPYSGSSSGWQPWRSLSPLPQHRWFQPLPVSPLGRGLTSPDCNMPSKQPEIIVYPPCSWFAKVAQYSVTRIT